MVINKNLMYKIYLFSHGLKYKNSTLMASLERIKYYLTVTNSFIFGDTEVIPPALEIVARAFSETSIDSDYSTSYETLHKYTPYS